jgi:hypothetical protein
MTERNDRIDVAGGLYWQSRFFAATAPVWKWLSDLETRAVADEIDDIKVRDPIYVTSLARAGTTIVTEMLEAHPALACHHYSDFPNAWTPYWRNHLLQRTRRQAPRAAERAHRDRIVVSHDSPEAVEEVLWMAFFEGLHDPSKPGVLDESSNNAAFERFYRDHIRKLLAVRRAERYLAKGNYNISRLAYLQRLCPDARFLVPVRAPQQHIASLIKQHRLFSRGHALDARVGRQLAMSGHFEFGPFRRAVHFGDAKAADAIEAAWREGREIEGWARYWTTTYAFLADQLEARPALADRCLLFTYEDLCTESKTVIDAILAHCDLDPQPFAEARARYAERLSLPDYYDDGLTGAESDLVETLCGNVYTRIRKRCLET